MSDLTHLFGFAIQQFLWQGLVIGAVAWIGLACTPRSGAPMRYAISCAALVASVVTFGLTLGLSWSAAPQTVTWSADGVSVARLQSALLGAPESRSVSHGWTLSTWISAAWLTGSLIMLLRFVRAARWARRLQVTATVPGDARLQSMLEDLMRDLGIRRAVRLMQSAHIDGPMVVGWLRPLVLVPASTLMGLSPDQLRCVLAHELAHIRRFDHLINALQALVEVTLFFHPVVWWLSGQMRAEREHCCDLAATRTTGDPRLLAEALTRLESIRLLEPHVALAAKAHGGPLMQRITRILDSRTAPKIDLGRGLRTAFAAGALLLGVGVAQASIVTPAAELAWSTPDDDLKTEYKKIAERIREAVAAGELSAADAETTLIALRKTMFRDAQPAERKEPARSDLVEAKQRLEQLVKEGKITNEEMRKRLARMRESMADQDNSRRFTREEYAAAVERMKKMVAEGEITEEAMKRRLQRMEIAMEGSQKAKAPTLADYEVMEAEVKRLVAEGKITREQAQERIDRFKKRMAGEGEMEEARRRYAEAEKQLIEMVAAGKISKEDADKRLREMAEHLFGKPKSGSERIEAFDLEAVVKDIEAAVKAGKLTRQEAGDKIQKIKEGLRRREEDLKRGQEEKLERDKQRAERKRSGGQGR